MSSPNTLTARILKGSTIVLIFTFLASPFGYFIRMLYSRTLSIEMFGLFYACLSLFSLISAYNDLGFGYSVSYLIPKYIKNKELKLAYLCFKYEQIIEVSTSVIISALILLLSHLLSTYYFKSEQAITLLHIFVIYFIASSYLEALNRFFIGLQQEAYYSSIQFIKTFFTLAFSLLFLAFDQGNVVNYAIAWAISYTLTATLYTLLSATKNADVKGKLYFDKELFHKMYSYAIPTLVTTSIYVFITSIDTVFLTLFRNISEVGIYNIILPIASIINIFLSPINTLLLPLVSHLMEGEKHKLAVLCEKIMMIIPFIGLYFALFISLFTKISVSLLFGNQWISLVQTPLIIIVFGYIFASLSGFLTTLVSGMGRVKERFYATVILAVSNVILSAIFIYYFGVLGAVIANSLIYVLSVIIFSFIVSKTLIFKVPLIFYVKLTFFAIIFYLGVRFSNLYPVNLWQFILTGMIYTLIMAVVAFYFKLIDKNMIELLFKFRKG